MARPFLVLFLATLTASLAQPGVTGTLYTVPNGTFYQQTSGETVTTINDTSGSISTLQTAINSARTANASRFLIINLKSNSEYLVTTSPLILGSKMCLSGSSNTSIAASPSSTATCLIKITGGSSYTSVNFLTLNGNRANLYGIEASGVNRVNLDQLIIRKTGKDGIFMQGLGAEFFDNEVTVTRCEISEATTAAGIHLSDTTQAVCLDNLCYNNSYGILLESSAHAALVNNQAKFNTDSGICLTNASTNKITHNLCQGNGIGLSIAGTTTSNLRNVFVSNEIRTSSYGISLGGYANVLYDNLFSSDVTSPLVLRSDAGANRIIPTSGPLSAPGQDYFYPPTSLNSHTNTIINGKNRIEVTSSATSLSAIQTTYNATLASYPSDVIVLKLTAPQITGDNTLSLASNTCVLLDGTIKLNSGVTAFSATSNSYISISGGTVDGQNYTAPRNGLAFANCSRILIKKVWLINFGNKNIRTNSDVIAFAGCTAPAIVSDCTINGGSGRGIWTKGNSTSSTSGFILNDNSISNLNMDGIDFDVTTSASLAIDNTCSNNLRYGVFTEEDANLNHIIRNICNSNEIGLNVYSTDNGPTIQNTFIGNTCTGNQRGIRFGAASPLETSHNFAFNNKIYSSTTGALDSQSIGSQNYISQSFLSGNSANLGSTTSALFFNSRSSSSSFASSTGYFNWQQSFAWSASTSQPDADPNLNGVPNLLEYALDLNPLDQTPPALPVVAWDASTPDGPWLAFTYRRNKSAMDLTYGVQTSTDLVNWSSITPNGTTVISEIANSNPDADGSSELLRIRIKISPTESKRFLRLRVTRE